MSSIELKSAFEHRRELKELYTEYINMLVEHEPAFSKYYNLQDFDEEAEHLAVKCGLPSGRLYVVFVDGEPAGCGGLAFLDDERCEMKSIYLRPKFRGQHISVMMLDKLYEDAKEMGYRHIVLETMPFLNAALHLYRSRGFYETERYYNSPMEHAIFLECDL